MEHFLELAMWVAWRWFQILFILSPFIYGLCYAARDED